MLGLFMSASRFDTDDLDDLDEPNVRSSGGLLQLVKGAFRVLVVVLFWIIPIGCAIAGVITGGIIGLLIGVVVGILVDIVYGGFVATLLVIEETTARMEETIIEMHSFLKKNVNVANAVNTVDRFDVGTAGKATQHKTTVNMSGVSSEDATFDCG